jgi:hypothetical protein
MNKSLPFVFLFTLGLFGCSSDEQTDKKAVLETKAADFTTNHFNITIASDLSNRLNTKLYPKAIADSVIVNLVLDNVYPRILKHQRSMNQLDQVRIDFINKQQITAYNINTDKLQLDFARFGNKQQERIGYLKKDFVTDKEGFKNEFKRTYERALAKSFGSDIWTYLQQGIDEAVVNKHTSLGKTGNKTFLNQYRNTLILITDGYIEAGIYGKGYDLSGKKIEAFRKSFLSSGDADLLAFYNKNPQHWIKALNNPLLKDLEVLVLELYDRSEGAIGAKVHPTDYEIMKIFWSDWLKRSGAKRVELRPKFSNKQEASKVVMGFLGV